jgi:hypothetical protein
LTWVAVADPVVKFVGKWLGLAIAFPVNVVGDWLGLAKIAWACRSISSLWEIGLGLLKQFQSMLWAIGLGLL